MVSLNEKGIRTYNYYWNKKDAYNITDAELFEVGITGNDIVVNSEVADKLIDINSQLRDKGYELIVKDGYRSKEMYELIYRKRVEMFGEESVNKLLNMQAMPHATGFAFDAVLWDIDADSEVQMHNKPDAPDALFKDFYKHNPEKDIDNYQMFQELLINTMLDNGLTLGSKNEYFHFELSS